MHLVHLRAMGSLENLCGEPEGWWSYVIRTATCADCLRIHSAE